jgi:hypothetical protein
MKCVRLFILHQHYDYSYETATLTVMADIQLQMDQFATAPALTTIGELMEILDIISAKSQMQQGSSHVESSHRRLASGKPQCYICILSLQPNAVSNWSLIMQSRCGEPVSLYPCTTPPQPITIPELDSNE